VAVHVAYFKFQQKVHFTLPAMRLMFSYGSAASSTQTMGN